MAKKTKKEEKEKDKQMSMDDLDQVVGGLSWKTGTHDDDAIFGDGDDNKIGGLGGADFMVGGAGDDTIDGGYRDNADDVAVGGAGDDTYFWGVSRDGSDSFIGGEDNDTIKLDLHTVPETSIQEAFNNGTWTIDLADANGDMIVLTDDMWDKYGNLILPPETSGVITGPSGDTLTFTGVEKIATLK